MNQITEAFVKAIVDHAGEIVMAAIAVVLAAFEWLRRKLVASEAENAVAVHSGDREAAEESVARAPRLARPLTKRGTQKVVKRALLKHAIRKQQVEEAQVAALERATMPDVIPVVGPEDEEPPPAA